MSRALQLLGSPCTTFYSCLKKGNSVDLQKPICSEIWNSLLWSCFSACWHQCIGFHLSSPWLLQALALTVRDRSNVTVTWWTPHKPYNLFSANLFLSLGSNDNTVTNWPSNPYAEQPHSAVLQVFPQIKGVSLVLMHAINVVLFLGGFLQVLSWSQRWYFFSPFLPHIVMTTLIAERWIETVRYRKGQWKRSAELGSWFTVGNWRESFV